MQIAIMNYATSDVRIIWGCPDWWMEDEIKEYLYTEKGLKLRESDCFFMAGDEIDLLQEPYNPTKGE